MLHRLHRLGFDEEVSLETFCPGVVAGLCEHGSQMGLFPFHVSVQERHVAFASAPEDIVFSSEFYSGIDGVLDLEHGSGCSREVRVCSRTVHVSWMAEYVGCPPQKLDAGLCLFLFGVSHYVLHVFLVLFRSLAFLYEVDIVEAIVFETYFLHDFETGIHLCLGPFQSRSAFIPREFLRSCPELVRAVSPQSMPPCH